MEREIMQHPLHPHPGYEEKIGINQHHVVIDVEAFVKFSGISYKGFEAKPGQSAIELIEHAINWLKCGYMSNEECLQEMRYLERGLHNLLANKRLLRTQADAAN